MVSKKKKILQPGFPLAALIEFILYLLFHIMCELWCVKIKKELPKSWSFLYIYNVREDTGDLYSAEYCYYVYSSTVSRIGFKSSVCAVRCYLIWTTPVWTNVHLSYCSFQPLHVVPRE